MENLNKGMLIDAVMDTCGNDLKSHAAAERVVNAVLGTVVNAISEGREVRIDKFGFFKVVKTSARMGRNPQDNSPMEIPAGQKVKFTPAGAMKAAASAAPVPD